MNSLLKKNGDQYGTNYPACSLPSKSPRTGEKQHGIRPERSPVLWMRGTPVVNTDNSFIVYDAHTCCVTGTLSWIPGRSREILLSIDSSSPHHQKS